MNHHGNTPPTLSIYTHYHHPTQSQGNEEMATTLKRSKDLMGRSKPEVRCKKHPKHKQSPGVCSICLSEKLSRLSNNSSRSNTTATASSCSSSSSLSSYSSSSASSCSSPTHRYGFSFSEAKGSMSFLRSSKNVLMKSRSVAFVPRMRGGEGKKKGGFWSKLLHPRRKGTDEVLVHSRTVRERVTS